MAKEQIGPRVQSDVAETYRDFVTFTNDGSYKGRLGDEVEHALKYHVALYFMQNPSELRRASHSEYVDNEKFAEQVQLYVDQMTNDISKAAQELKDSQIRRDEASNGSSEATQDAYITQTPSDKIFTSAAEPEEIEEVMEELEDIKTILRSSDDV